MQLNYHNIINQDKSLGKATIYIAFISIDDYKQEASQLISSIANTSWLKMLDKIDRISFETKVNNTTKKMIEIFKSAQSTNKIQKDFGEYLISLKSSEHLATKHHHKQFPLSELWKEKVSGNGGFDFHTESPSEHITFGEAKYRSRENAYADATIQIVEFISPENNKDLGDASYLRDLKASINSLNNLINGNRNFAAGFSLHSKNYKLMEKHLMKDPNVLELINVAEELFLIGFEIC